MKKSTPPSYFINCKKILDIQKSKMRKLKKKVSKRYVCHTDFDFKENEDENTCLLKKEEVYADKECDLVNKIMKDNSNKIKKMDRDYRLTYLIYDDVGCVVMEQSDETRKIDAHIGKSKKYLGKTNDETTPEDDLNTEWGNSWVIWLVILVTLIMLFVFVIFR